MSFQCYLCNEISYEDGTIELQDYDNKICSGCNNILNNHTPILGVKYTKKEIDNEKNVPGSFI